MSSAIAVIDFETTGMSPTQGARATEVAIVLLEQGQVVDRFQSLMQTGAWVSPFITDLTGITNAMLRTIIPTREYPKAQSLNQGRDSVVSIAGSPLGGVLYAVAPWLPFAVASLMYAISGVSAAQLRVDEHVRDMVTTDRKSKRPDTASQAGCTSDAAVAPDADATAESAHTSFFEDFIEGWRWTLRRHTLLAICVIAALVNFGLNGVFAAVNLQLVSTHVDSVRLGFINTVM